MQSDSLVYVVASYYYTSGGTESLHQLVSTLNELGIDSYIYYYDNNNVTEVPDKFEKYNIKICNKIIDDKKNILVVPETQTNLLYGYKNIGKCIWWLSLDFYYQAIPKYNFYRLKEKYGLPVISKLLLIPYLTIKNGLPFKYFDFREDKNKIVHLYNCEYIKNVLLNKGVLEQNTKYLCGPISNEYFEKYQDIDTIQKEDIIVYNPKKGLEYTQQLIKAIEKDRANIKIIPIINMKPIEIVDLLSKAKVYMDFGNFPGPERIPREAVLMKCNLVTSNLGSANNKVDVLIPTKYKFEREKESIGEIVKTIYELLDNYQDHINEYNEYREKVLNQPYLLKENLRDLFKMERFNY